jgi:hypothetical protein
MQARKAAAWTDLEKNYNIYMTGLWPGVLSWQTQQHTLTEFSAGLEFDIFPWLPQTELTMDFLHLPDFKRWRATEDLCDQSTGDVLATSSKSRGGFCPVHFRNYMRLISSRHSDLFIHYNCNKFLNETLQGPTVPHWIQSWLQLRTRSIKSLQICWSNAILWQICWRNVLLLKRNVQSHPQS